MVRVKGPKNMQRESTNSRVVDLTTYRQKRRGHDEEIPLAALADAEEAIEEIARHLLQAIKIVTARYRNNH
jgi:hypothetical protein